MDVNITIYEGAIRNSCQGTPDFVIGTSYILALSGGGDGKFYLQEPGAKNTAAFEPTPDNLQRSADICGMSPVNVTSGGRSDHQMAADCPSPSVDDLECIVPRHTGMSSVIQPMAGLIAFLLMYLIGQYDL